MKTLIFIFAGLVSFSAFAQQISDPQGLLAQSDQFLGGQSFQQNFVEGMKYTQSFQECSTFLPCQDPRLSHYAVSVRGAEATITDAPNSQMHVSENQWNAWQGNMIRAVLSYVQNGGFGNITVLDSHTGQMDVVIDGQKKSVEVFFIHATAKNQIGMSNDESMTVSRDLKGYAQLITWTEKQFAGAIYTRTMTEFSH